MRVRSWFLTGVLVVAVIAGACVPSSSEWNLERTVVLGAPKEAVLFFIATEGRRRAPEMRHLGVMIVSDAFVAFGGGTSSIVFSATSVGQTTRLAVRGGRSTEREWIDPLIVALTQTFR